MQLLKADTLTKVLIGPVVAVGDGFTPVTTLSLSTADEAELLKHDAAAVTDISGNTFAAITSADGYYNLTITAAQLDTEGRLTVLVNDDSLCLPVRHDFMVVNANVYDSLYGAATTDYLQVDAVQISSDTTAADNLELQYDGTGLTGGTYPATQTQIGNIASGSAAISTISESYVLTTGTQSANLYTDTATRNGVRHEHTDAAGVLDLYYQFDITGNGVGVEADIYGYLTSANDSVDVFAYDWSGAAWDQVGTLDGGSAADAESKYNLTVSHTGTGANLGKVRIRFYAASGLSTATLAIDQIICSYAVVSNSVGYEGGKVWIDTTSGTAGTESFVNGVADNPVDTLADAKTIAANVGLDKYNVSNDSSITLVSSTVAEEIFGVGWTLALGGQDISNSHFEGANSVTGTSTSPTGESHFIECEFGAASVGNSHFNHCGFEGTLTLVQATDYFMVDCYSQVAGSGSPVIDMGAAVGATNLSIRRWAGGITINNLAAGDVVTLDGTFGTVTLNGADATVEIRGIYKSLSNNLTGSPAVNIGGAMRIEDIVSNGAITTSAGAVANVDLVDVCTTNTDMRGTDSANTVAPDNTSIAAILVDTADMQPRIGTMETDVNNLDLGIIYGTAATGTLTTTSATTNLTGYADNQLTGAYIVVTSGAAEGERRAITAYTEIGGVIEFAAMTIAMANNDTFKIV